MGFTKHVKVIGSFALRLSVAMFCATAFFLMMPVSVPAVTVQEVASELECPCECPLILEDCNMSCGLSWKDEIGEKIKAGMTKDQIIDDFVRRYGQECRITPSKRLRGKFYQYTRGFGTKEWAAVAAAAGLWVAAMLAAVYLVVRRVSKRKKNGGRDMT